jgi:hypothetical protein
MWVTSRIFYSTRIMVYFTWRPCEAMHVSSVSDILYHTQNGLFHMTILRGHACKLWEGLPTWKSYKIISHEDPVTPSMWVMWKTFYVGPLRLLHMKALQGDSCRVMQDSYRIVPKEGSCEDHPCETNVGLFNTRALNVSPRVVLHYVLYTFS